MSRLLSLLLAGAVSAGLLLLPAMRGRELTRDGHLLLTPLLLLVCLLLVHGLGWVPQSRGSRRLLHPLWLWPATLALAAGFVLHS